MPLYRPRARATTRKYVKKTATYRKKPVYKRRPAVAYRRKAPIRRRVPRKLAADAHGAEFLANQLGLTASKTTNPALLSMYRSIARSSQSKISSVRIPGRQPIADVYKCHLKFSLDDEGMPASGTAQSFLGNGLIDPSLGAGTGNPAYVPNLGNLYAYYRVTGSRITVRVTNTDIAQPITVIVFPTLVPPVQWTVSNPIALNLWAESAQPYKVFNVGNANSSMNVKQLTYSMGTAKLFNSQADVEDFAGLMPGPISMTGSNPAAPFLWYWGIQCYNADGSPITAANVTYTLVLGYDVELYQPLPDTATMPFSQESDEEDEDDDFPTQAPILPAVSKSLKTPAKTKK